MYSQERLLTIFTEGVLGCFFFGHVCIIITITIIIIINTVLNSSWELFLATQAEHYIVRNGSWKYHEIEVYGTNSWLIVSIKNRPL